MIWLILGGVLLLLFGLLLYKEPRRFLNVVILILSVSFLFIGFCDVMGESETVSTGLCVLMFGIVPLVLILMAVLLIINGFVMLRKEGKRIKNLLSLFTGFAVIAGLVSVVLLLLVDTSNFMAMSSLWLAAILSLYFAATFSALLLYSWLYLILPKHKECDYIIVHGCGLLGGERISQLLRGRVDKAVEIYRKLDKKPMFVLSGGQGRDEKISEAQAMKNYLLEQGFNQEDVLLEDKSTTTYENLRNVKQMLDTNRSHKYLFVTNDYHVFRTSIFAKKLKMNAAGVGCKTARYYWPSAFIREYVAVMVQYKWITIAVLFLWAVMLVISLLPI